MKIINNNQLIQLQTITNNNTLQLINPTTIIGKYKNQFDIQITLENNGEIIEIIDIIEENNYQHNSNYYNTYPNFETLLTNTKLK